MQLSKNVKSIFSLVNYLILCYRQYYSQRAQSQTHILPIWILWKIQVWYIISVERDALVVKYDERQLSLWKCLFKQMLKRSVANWTIKPIQIDPFFGILLAFVILVIRYSWQACGFMKFCFANLTF